MSKVTASILRLAKENPEFRKALKNEMAKNSSQDEEAWAKVHHKLAKIMSSKIKGGSPTHDFWASTASLPRDVGHGMYWQFGTQTFPKGKNAYISLYTPMFAAQSRPMWGGLYMDLGEVLRKAERILRPLGKVRFTSNDKAFQLWLDLDPGKEEEAEKILTSLAKRLADVTDKFVKHAEKKSKTASEKTSSARLIPSLKRAINKDLMRAGLDGRARFRKPEQGYTKALEVLADFGIELDEVVSSHLFKGPKGVVTVDVAFSNPEDSFSPDSISNSMLRLDFTDVGNGYEMIGYMS